MITVTYALAAASKEGLPADDGAPRFGGAPLRFRATNMTEDTKERKLPELAVPGLLLRNDEGRAGLRHLSSSRVVEWVQIVVRINPSMVGSSPKYM